MSFDNYSDSDIPIVIDDLSAEIEKQKALIHQLGFALIEAWPMVHQPFTSTTRQNEVQRAMFAFREWCGPDDQPGMLPTLAVDRFNPWKDTIEIEGVVYSGELFRAGGFGGAVGKCFCITSRDNEVVTITEKVSEHD